MNELTFGMATKTGMEQAEVFCRGLFDANALYDLTSQVCCQAYYYDMPDTPGTFGILSTATGHSYAYVEDVTWAYIDANDEWSEGSIQVGATILDLTSEYEEESAFSLGCSLATGALTALLLT